MNLLIVGGSGFVGRNCVAHFAAQYPSATLYATHRGHASFETFAHNHDVSPIALDLSTPAAIAALPECDTCLYVAGNANHAVSARDAQRDVESLLNFLEKFRGRLIFLSSGAVYYNLEGKMSEHETLSPRFPYGVTKFVLEQYVQRHFDIGQLQQFTILRLFYAFGPYERPTRLTRRVIEAIQAKASAFTVSAEGQSYLDPLSARDVARAIDLVIKTETCNGKILNLCRGEPYRVSAFVAHIAESLGHALEIRGDGIPENLPVKFWGDPARLQSLTGFEPEPLSDAIRAYADHIAGLS